MNQTKLAYVRNRANDIKKNKLAEISARHYTPAVHLSTSDKLKALRAGEFTIDQDKVNNSYYWYNSIKFNGETRAETNTEQLKKEQVEVEAAFTKLMDELMLGDDEEAIRLLAAFEKL